MKCLFIVVISISLISFSMPSHAHNGAVAIATPIEGIVVDGNFDDWPDGLVKYDISRRIEGEDPKNGDDFSGYFSIAYSESDNSIYVAIEISDESFVLGDNIDLNAQSQDGIEVYVKLNHMDISLKPNMYRIWGERADVGGYRRKELGGREDFVVEFTRENGIHRYEWQIDIGKISDGMTYIKPDITLGFDISIWDKDKDGSETEMAWGRGGGKWLGADLTGDLILTDKNSNLPQNYSENIDHILMAVQSRSGSLMLLIGLSLSFTILHLLIFAFHPSSKSNLFLAILLASLIGTFFIQFNSWFDVFPTGLGGLITNLTVFIAIISTHLFLTFVFYGRVIKHYWIILLGYMIGLVWTVLVNLIPDMTHLPNTSLSYFLQIIFSISLIELIRMFIASIYKKREGVWSIGFGVVGILMSFGFKSSNLLMSTFCFIAGLVSISIHLAKKTAKTNKALETQIITNEKLSQLNLEQERALRQRMAEELEQARQLQLSMLPQDKPTTPNLEISWYMETATEVGGDYYDYSLAEDGTLTITLGDATGHGMQAGTVVTATKSLFQSHAEHPRITETFSVMSRSLKGMNFPRLGMAMTILKISDRTLRVSSAGIPPTLIYRAETGQVEEVELAGMPLGYSTRAQYEERELELNVNDVILLMSDGLPERLNNRDEELGYPRSYAAFQELAEQLPEEICKGLYAVGGEWADGRPQDDDITFVVLKVK